MGRGTVRRSWFYAPEMADFRDAQAANAALELRERVPAPAPGLPAGAELAQANLYAVAELVAARAPRESSRRQYRLIFRRFADVLRDELGRPPLVADLTADTIAAYARQLEASGGRGGRPTALATRRGAHHDAAGALVCV